MAETKVYSIYIPTRSKGRHWVLNFDPEPPMTESTRVFTVNRERTGQRLPKWKAVIEAGGNATTPLTAVFETAYWDRASGTHVLSERQAPFFQARHENEGDIVVTNNISNKSCPLSTASAALTENLARAAFLKALRRCETAFNGLTFAGELRETLGMLRRPAAAMRNNLNGYLEALRKRKRFDPRGWINAASGTWLEHTFGWQPLINDCKDAVEAYSRLTVPKPKTKVVSGGSKLARDQSKAALINLDSPGESRSYMSGCVWRVHSAIVFDVLNIRYKGKYVAQVDAPQWDKQELFGFDARSFIPTAWELLPWSFLADYFTNIGDLLDAVVTRTQNLAYCNRTQRFEIFERGILKLDPTATAKSLGSAWSAKSWGGSDQVSYELTRKEIVRSAGSTVPMPNFQIEFSLSDGQLGNIAALLGQAIQLHPQRYHYRR